MKDYLKRFITSKITMRFAALLLVLLVINCSIKGCQLDMSSWFSAAAGLASGIAAYCSVKF